MNKKDYSLKVIVCPLDWGLGHATRCVPVIRELLDQGAEVLIAGDGPGMDILKEEFPDIKQERLKGYGIRFSERFSIGAYLILSLPRLFLRIIMEHYQLAELILRIDAHAVISDNRYGLWNKKVYSVFITHQPNIVPPARFKSASSLLRRIIRFFIRKYNECWIPDFSMPPGLSGRLSHGFTLPENVKFIGPLSRFEKEKINQDALLSEDADSYEIVAIISGPEPHRSHFEKILVQQLNESNLKSLLIRGVTDASSSPLSSGNLTVVNYLNSRAMFPVLMRSKVVVCRGGYSTLMDLSVTGNKVICIPTPGQSEQEYLAASLSQQGYAVFTTEENFNLSDCYIKVLQTQRLPDGPADIADSVKLLLEKIRANHRI